MSNRLFVGNLAFHVTEDLLKQHVSQHGDVQSVDLILDRLSGRPLPASRSASSNCFSPASASSLIFECTSVHPLFIAVWSTLTKPPAAET